jgi:hypothetical protein
MLWDVMGKDVMAECYGDVMGHPKNVSIPDTFSTSV